MLNKPNVIVLGGNYSHVPLINNLKARGYNVILVDYLDKPIGAFYSDQHLQISTFDKDAVLEIAKENSAKFIITTNVDQINITACYVSEQLGLPHPYSYASACLMTNKLVMKKTFIENDISTAKQYEFNSLEEVTNYKGDYPLIVKPVDLNGSKGVHKASSLDELIKYYDNARTLSRSGRVIVEDYIDGVEQTYYYFVKDNQPVYLFSSEKKHFRPLNDEVIQSTGVISLSKSSNSIHKTMEEYALKICKAFNINNSPLFIQTIVKSGKPYVLEFAARNGGGLSSIIIKEDCGVDLLDLTIDAYIGNEYEIGNLRALDGYTAVLTIYAPEKTISKIDGLDIILNNKYADSFHQYVPLGEKMAKDMSSRSRIGAFIIRSKNKEGISKKVSLINSTLKVLDDKGDDFMRHDIYGSWFE